IHVRCCRSITVFSIGIIYIADRLSSRTFTAHFLGLVASACVDVQKASVSRQNGRWRDLYVAKESRPAALFPIRRLIVFNAKARTQRAEKRMLRWLNHDSNVSLPHNQVSWLWPQDTPERVCPCVQFNRVRILVGESCLLVNRIYKVRAIGSRTVVVPELECGTDDGETFISVKQPC